MLERSLKRDLFALALLAVSVFLGASLFTYDPADPPSTLVFPARSETLNACGRSGALVSTFLFTSLGFGAYYLLGSLVVFDLLLLVRRDIAEPWLRAMGWLLSLVGLTTLTAMAFPRLSPGPVIGSGGYVGAAGRTLLEMHFANVGAFILVISVSVGGLLLCTDYILLRILALTLGAPAKELGRGVVRVGMAYSNKLSRRRSDLDPCPSGDEEMTVHIGGRPPETAEAADATKPAEPEEKPAAESEAGSQEPRVSEVRITKPGKSPREKVMEEIEAASHVNGDSQAVDYELPSIDLLLQSTPFCFDEQEQEVRRKAKILEKTFANFGFNVRVVEIQTGPVIAQFEVELEAGLRLSKITGLADDLAIALRVPSVRIVAPIPGKNTVGIEVPNSQRQIVRIREVMEETAEKVQSMRIPIFLGKDVAGTPMLVDLSSLPHLLIAGRTGTGKSVCLNSIIVSMVMTRRPDEVRMLLVDPKMVELSPYKNIPHLMHPVVTDMRKAEAILAWAVEKMEERYHLLAAAGVRHISVYNQLGVEELMERISPSSEEERASIPLHLPYIVIVADEMADLMMTAAKEVEGHIIRLAQKSRAVGIHLVLATQKPTVDVITGLIKSNLPARICFQVASRTDSRVVLDEMGADKLLGNGDMLFLWPGTSTLIRGQGTYLSDDEIARVIESVATTEPQFVTELVQLKPGEPEGESPQLKNRDELYEAAVDLVVREGRGSVSLLQRAMGIGYGRAARLIDFMAEDGLVGPYNGSQAREILITLDDWEKMRGQPGQTTANSKAPRTNKILMDSGESASEEEPADDDVARTDRSAKESRRLSGPSRSSRPTPPWEEVSSEADEKAGRPAGDDGSQTARDVNSDELFDEPDDEEEDEEEEEENDYEDLDDDEASSTDGVRGGWKAESA